MDMARDIKHTPTVERNDKMPHTITFTNVYNTWKNALPLGNGKMGAMVFFKDHALHIALNHYDCYYASLHRYNTAPSAPRSAPRIYEDYCKTTDEARKNENYERAHYIDILNPNAKNKRPQWTTQSHPQGGEIVLPLNKAIEEFTLCLHIEEAVVTLEAQGASAKVWIPHQADGIFIELDAATPNAWGEADLIMPGVIGQQRYNYEQGATGNTKWLRSSFNDKTAETAVTQTAQTIVASVIPAHGENEARNQWLLQEKESLATAHAQGWHDFWKAKVTLPDPFLETLWYLHLYALGCASGLGGRYFEQACGLNGLWDIRKPTLWGSTWYWDVNIQEAFWPVFSSNQLALAELFCDAYLTYEESILSYTETIYGTKDTWALDYCHPLYLCIQPWCAQFLWKYYSHSGDVTFLKERAYPVFVKQIEHFKFITRVDEGGKRNIDYDISPEQGPISRNSVISIASMRQLIKYAIKSAKIIGRPMDEVQAFSALLQALPDYTRTEDGLRWKDSEMAPDDLFLRHPSVLMPIFPAEEVNKHSPAEVYRCALNTLRFAAQNTEIGAFGFGWLSCAASRLGEGTAAVRILYEKGLDYLIHSNGLGYEETERYVNHCLITKPPMYPPAMMEPTGGIVMSINAMLLTSDNAIEVFPAVPNGVDNLKERKAQYRYHDDYLQGEYPAWENVRFDRMLANGGFEVSAQMKNGRVCWLHVRSNHGGEMKVRVPASLTPNGKEEIFSCVMEPGEERTWGEPQAVCVSEAPSPAAQIRNAANTGRRVFLGEDRHTEFYKKVDSFACAYLLGNTLQYQMMPYIFDFGDTGTQKDYDSAFHKAYCMSGYNPTFFSTPKRWGNSTFDPNLGYGFASNAGLGIIDRQAPDAIRRDGVEGTTGNAFQLSLPRGKYNLMVVSGDENEASLTHIQLPHNHSKYVGEIKKAGTYQCRIIPFMQEEDGLFELLLNTDKGHKWKLNALFLTQEYYA